MSYSLARFTERIPIEALCRRTVYIHKEHIKNASEIKPLL